MKLTERGGPYMARYAGDRRRIGREMRLYNDLKGYCPVGIKELHATSRGQERLPTVTRQKCARNAASTGAKCADCSRSSRERPSSGPATGSGTPRRILPRLRQQQSRSCKFTTNPSPVFCGFVLGTGACRWRGRRPLAPQTLQKGVPDSGRAARPRSPLAGPSVDRGPPIDLPVATGSSS